MIFDYIVYFMGEILLDLLWSLKDISNIIKIILIEDLEYWIFKGHNSLYTE